MKQMQLLREKHEGLLQEAAEKDRLGGLLNEQRQVSAVLRNIKLPES